MAIIGKIRSHSRLLVGIIGIALLFFIFGTFFENIPKTIQKFLFGQVEYGIGTIYGEKVDANSYNFYCVNSENNDQNQASQSQKEYTPKDRQKSQDNAWQYIIDSTILSKEFPTLGISVSEKEFNAYLYATDDFPPLQDLVKQFFTDTLTGTMSEKSIILGRKKLQAEIKKLKSSKDPQAIKQWKGTKQYYTNQRKQQKYFALLDQGVYVTNLEAEEEYMAQKKTKNISFVVRRYDEIKDTDTKVSESALKKYYDAHKADKKYANLTSSRELKLFTVKVAPSKKDFSFVLNELNTLKSEFMKSTNDSLFVLKNSKNKYYTGKLATAVPEGHPKANNFQSYPASLDQVFKESIIGQIMEPYQMQENIILSKVIGFTPEKLKARHILIATNNSTDVKVISAKEKIADSLLKLINKDNFTELVTKYTDDPGSKETGGLYENFLEAEMVTEFSSFCATQPIGTIAKVKTNYGFHIIEVLERSTLKFPLLASISKKINASEETVSAKEKEVEDILEELDGAISRVLDPLSKSELFDKIAGKNKYSVRSISIQDNSPNIDSIQNTSLVNTLIKFAYSKKAVAGALINSPIKDNDNYIVAMIVSIKEKGAPKYADIKKTMKKDLMIEMKAEKLIKSMSIYKTMDGLAKAFNTQILNAEILFSNPQITGGGYEPEIIGSLFASIIKDKKRTLPIKGKTGVYVVRIDKTTNPPVAANYKIERDQLYSALKGSVQLQAIGALRKKADIIDNRKLNELKIRL